MIDMTDIDFVSVYVTAGDEREARAIGRTLVSEKLAACANVFPRVTSIYNWKGEAQEDSEAVLILKTRKDLLNTLKARIIKLHSYDCPCVVAWPIVEGLSDYLLWLGEETEA